MTRELKYFTDTNAVANIRTRATELLAKLDAGTALTPAETRQLAEDVIAVADDSTHWYTRADSWRESYRLVKGLSDDELNAQEAIEEASRTHDRPCWFPHEACVCE
jgi:hypothetical protein